MPLDTSGVYVGTVEDQPYEWETTYYLDFQIFSSLKSIEKLFNRPADIDELKQQAQYYHYYLDHLFYSIRQISSRFVINGKDNDDMKKRKEQNRTNYQFSDSAFPVLSSKQAGNTIEHLDEHNAKVIIKNRGVGGFNFIDKTSNQKLISALTERRNQHPYILDLINCKVYIQRNEKEISIDLKSLQKELTLLQKNVSSFQEYLQDFI